MKSFIRNLLLLFVTGMLLALMSSAGSDAKMVKIVPDVKKGKTKTIYTVKTKKGRTTVKKMTVKTSNKSVASVKVTKAKGGKKYYVKVTGKNIGSVMVTVKVRKKLASGKIKTSTLWFSTDVWGDEKQRAKEAFELQNAVRRKAGQKELDWSEELYKIAVVRVKNDGFDSHQNFHKRWDEHFSIDGITPDNIEWGGENLYIGSANPADAIKSWRNSSGHYRNMVDKDYHCGAIAYSEKTNTWVAIFSKNSLSAIENWRIKTPLLRLCRIDNITGDRIRGSEIRIVDDVGNEVYRGWSAYIFNSEIFTVGKTYTVIEISAPDGYRKAANVTFIAQGALDGPIEIVLSSDKK